MPQRPPQRSRYLVLFDLPGADDTYCPRGTGSRGAVAACAGNNAFSQNAAASAAFQSATVGFSTVGGSPACSAANIRAISVG